MEEVPIDLFEAEKLPHSQPDAPRNQKLTLENILVA